MRFGLLIGLLLSLAGCTGPAYRNVRLETFDPHAGYRFDALRNGDHNTDEVFVCLTFSGGGTRAAALAYGVLQELRDTPLEDAGVANPGPRRLLDEVDAISSVSGGSFTALGYGLWRDVLFDGRYEQQFLKRDTESALIGHLLAPQNLVLLPFVLLDTIDVAADYYDRRIFQAKRYADLLAHAERPYVVVNATNLALGRRFEFTQDDFDILASDLGRLPLGYAAAASSAFPIVFSPMRLRYFPSPKGSNILRDVITADEAEAHNERRWRWARTLVKAPKRGQEPEFLLDEWHHRYLYVVDGGLADNLGLAHFIHEYQHGYIARRLAEGRISRLLLIIVDAGTCPRETLEQEASSPGILTVGYKTAITGIENHNATMVQMMRYLLNSQEAARAAYERCREALQETCPDVAPPADLMPPTVDAYVVHVNFTCLREEEERDRCLSMPTRFCMPRGDVELLIRVGRQLLAADPEFRRFLRDVRAADSAAFPEEAS